MLGIHGYNTVRRDREGRHGGGVLTYIHTSLNYSVISHLEPTLSEALSIRIMQHSAKPFITSVIYRPPNSTSGWVDQFTLYVAKCKDDCDDLIITGDFNLNLLNQNRSWSNTINQLGLLQLIKQCTRIQPRSQSLIDHIYITKPNNIICHGVQDFGVSDHSLIYATRKLGIKTASPKPRTKITYLDWKNFSETSFHDELRATQWDDLYLTDSADSMLNLFTYRLQQIASNHLRVKTRFVKSSTIPPWLDEEVRLNIHRRVSLKRTKDWAAYKQQRNYTTNLIKRKKKEHVARLISQSNGKQTKHLWQVLRNSSPSNTLPKSLPHSNSVSLPSDDELASSLNLHFVNISKGLSSSTPTPPSQTIPPRSEGCVLSDFPTISPAQVILYFKDIPTNKATGSDCLSVKILQKSMPFIINPLTDVLNRAISCASFPSQWKTAIVTPLHKGGDSNLPCNYRPISVLPVLSKIYEKHIQTNLVAFLSANNIISGSQSGFRKHHSCTTTIHHLLSEWTDKIHSKQTLLLLFLDFQKAFDTVDHQILLQKLQSIGIGDKAYSIIRSYLTHRTQRVKIRNSFSSNLPITSGVPQGSVLAPTLFQIFINDLLHLPLSCSSHAYADDTTFYLADKDPSKLQQIINSDLKLIHNWCKTNRMTLNLSKSHYMVVNPCNAHRFTITIDNQPLEQRSSTKLLGFHVTDTLKWDDHILMISKKISSNLRLFYNIRHLMDVDTSKLFYFNYIHAYLINGIHIYFPLTPFSRTNQLFMLQKKALRLICADLRQSNKLLSTNLITGRTNVLPLPQLALYFTCLTAHRIKTGSCPPYLMNPFRPSTTKRLTRYQHKLPSSLHHNRLNLFLTNSFNNLPTTLRSLQYKLFKQKLKTFLMSNA